MGKKIMDDTLGFDPPNIPPPPAPAASALPPPPDITAAADRARMQRESQDAQRRKRGRASTVQTGAAGVGVTPVAAKTLVGS